MIYGHAHFWRTYPPSPADEFGIVRMLEMDYPGRTVAVIPVGGPARPLPPGSAEADYGKFDDALKTPVRPVLISLQQSPFRDFSAEEFLGRGLVRCRGAGVVPKQAKGKIQSAPVRASGPCVSVFQGSTLTLGQMADEVVYFGAQADVVLKAKPER